MALLEQINEDTKKALLTHAIIQDMPNLVRDILDKFSININSKYLENGSLILHKAATSGSVDCLKLLIALNCEVNMANDEGGNGFTSCSGKWTQFLR